MEPGDIMNPGWGGLDELTATEEDLISDLVSGVLSLLETTAPSATSGYGKLYVKSSDSNLYFKDDSGTETQLSGGAASGANAALSNLSSVAINTTLVSDTDNTDALGTTAIAWSDLFLGSGAVITFNSAPSTADMTITHSSNLLTIGGGAVGFADQAPTKITNFERVIFEDADGTSSDWTFRIAAGSYAIINFATSRGTLGTPTVSLNNDSAGSVSFKGYDGDQYHNLAEIIAKVDGTPGNDDMPGRIVFSTTADGASDATERLILDSAGVFKPAANDGVALGTTALSYSDLFLASGAVINFNAGDVTLTHSANTLTLAGGDLALGANSLTMTGSLAATGARVTKGWFTDVESTNMPTVGGTAIISDTAYGAGWNGATAVAPSQNAVYDQVELKANIASPTFTGTVTIPAASLTGALTLAENATIALDPAGSADGKYSGITISGTAGAALAFGDLVYLAAADSRWELADADSVTTSDRMLGMCVLAAAADGDPTIILLMGNIRADAAFPAMTIGSAMYVGETAGDIQVAIPTGADNVIRRVGYALTADELYFNPSMDSQTTVA